MSKRPKILYPYICPLNAGDAAIFISSFRAFKKVSGDNVDFILGADDLEEVSKRFPEFDFIPYSKNWMDKILFRGGLKILFWFFMFRFFKVFKYLPLFLLPGYQKELFKSVAESDLVVAPGGGYVTDVYHIHNYLLLFAYANHLNKPLYFQAQSFGPMFKKSTIRDFKQVLNDARFYIARDLLSLDKFKEYYGELPKNVVESVDQAFALDWEYKPVTKNKKIGMSMRTWSFKNYDVSSEEGMDRFKKSLITIVSTLVREYDYQVDFISTCQGEPIYVDDSKLAHEIYGLLDDDVKGNVYVNDDFHTPDDLKEIYKEYDFFVGTRMHSIIMNLMIGNPCFGIVYEFKTIELLKRLGLDEYTIEIDHTDKDELIGKLKKFIENIDSITEKSRTNVLKLKSRAQENVKIILEDYHKIKEQNE